MPPGEVHEGLVGKVEQRLRSAGYVHPKKNPVATVRADIVGVKEFSRGRRRIWLVEVETCESIHSPHAEDQLVDLEYFARNQNKWESARVSLCISRSCRRAANMVLLELFGAGGLVELLAL